MILQYAGMSTKHKANKEQMIERNTYFTVLFHQLSEVGEQWMMFSEKIELVTPLLFCIMIRSFDGFIFPASFNPPETAILYNDLSII